MSNENRLDIRPECLQPAKHWAEPTGPELQEVVRRAGFSGRAAEAFLGLSAKSDGRTIRKWISGETSIPYSAWALLCDAAGLGIIWRDES
ncbi:MULTISPECIES: transcriptional regulator [Burkholderia cepacia complex]|uniref:transcriptional regulator n=1 Tax=Burkholderia cepacia complex TaxID=87882 RepID=UPI0009B3FF3E|nr:MULTISPECIES: transcriptional regulator [Burkholderia cepacia complex]